MRHLAVIQEQCAADERDESMAPGVVRPRLRSECVDGPRPCPWMGCEFSLALDVSRRNGLITIVGDPDQMTDTCLLDVTDRGPAQLDELGAIYDLSRERIRQVETAALERLRASTPPDLLDDWAHGHEDLPDGSLDDVLDADFKAKVDAAYRRIVPENERGKSLLFYAGVK